MHCLCLGQSGEGIMAFAVSRVVGDAHLAVSPPSPPFWLGAALNSPYWLKEGASALSLLRSEWVKGVMAVAVSRVVGDAHFVCRAQPSSLAAGGSQPSVLAEGRGLCTVSASIRVGEGVMAAVPRVVGDAHFVCRTSALLFGCGRLPALCFG